MEVRMTIQDFATGCRHDEAFVEDRLFAQVHCNDRISFYQ